jgi:hypothetical protein
MKLVIICITCSCLFIQNIKSQDNLKSEQAKTHRALLASITFHGNQTMKVHIMNIKDSSVFVYQKTSGKPDPFHKVNIYAESGWDRYQYRFIESMKVRNTKLRSWLLPVSIVGGIVAGAIIGINTGGNMGEIGWELNNVAYGILGGLIGGAAGTMTGLIICSAYEKKYMINGDWKSFEEMKKSLKY